MLDFKGLQKMVNDVMLYKIIQMIISKSIMSKNSQKLLNIQINPTTLFKNNMRIKIDNVQLE